MSDLKVLRAVDYPRMPWKNGGGSTEEITRDAGTGLEGFGWRLSIADIGESGGFSTFAGYERVISVLQGDGMSLTVDGQVTRPLHPLDPFAFSGESHVHCTLLGGPIRDFNLIYSPQRYRARLQWLAGEQRFFSEAGTVLVFSADPELSVRVGDFTATLGLYDCLQLGGNTQLLEVASHGQCCVIELTAH
ncbi:HutD family protein [Pseudomonas corrugata]|uniref:HutD/Ves family protein n=1 Tax=Pseudomonas corrugata TaxID=47879 RepID=UPI00069FA824|nr:HutD family protein [Pseudomonas corrugata]MDU9021475.1 HutD family protein [Pseudomonas corrugata]MDU9033431.1 HutD family protein [Pseudomonas corrugata]MDU9034557.1 HutD family protein [Pseudomonas corrugata]MDU9039474.1 HutD family protein [Pseudomonas corrugata]UZE06669.1 HutD family protein [Pseudomonas corrugata]